MFVHLQQQQLTLTKQLPDMTLTKIQKQVSSNLWRDS